MKCPRCQTKVNELDKKCPICGLDFEQFEPESDSATKTKGLVVINVIQLISCIIMAIINLENGESLTALIFFISGIMIFFFIKGFADIIDLLDSINNKLDK